MTIITITDSVYLLIQNFLKVKSCVVGFPSCNSLSKKLLLLLFNFVNPYNCY